MSTERAKVNQALAAFIKEIDSIYKIDNEAGYLQALNGASRYFRRKSGSYYTETKANRLKEGDLKKKDEEERKKIIEENGSISGKGNVGKFTGVQMVDGGLVGVLPILTQRLESILLKCLKNEGANPFVEENIEEVDGRPKPSKFHGIIATILSDYSLISKTPEECAGHGTKKTARKLGMSGKIARNQIAGYLSNEKTRKGSQMSGTLLLASAAKTAMSRLASWNSQKEKNLSAYNDKVSKRSKGKRIDPMDFPRPEHNLKGMPNLRTIELKRKIAASELRKACGKLYPRCRTATQRKLLNQAARKRSMSMLNMLISTFKAIPPFNTSACAWPLSFIKDHVGVDNCEPNFFDICKEYHKCKFMGKNANGVKQAATLYLRGFTSTRNIPVGHMNEMVSGLAEQTSPEMVDACLETGGAGAVGTLAITPNKRIEYPSAKGREELVDTSMATVDQPAATIGQIILGLEVNRPVAGRDEKGEWDPMKELIEEAKKGDVAKPIILDATGAVTTLGKNNLRNFCTDGEDNKAKCRMAFLINKSEFDKEKSMKSRKRRFEATQASAASMDLETPSTS